MFARATSGDKRNNNKFSPCSLRSINAVLNTKAKSLKGCFQGRREICDGLIRYSYNVVPFRAPRRHLRQ